MSKTYVPLPEYVELKRQGVIHRAATFQEDNTEYLRRSTAEEMKEAKVHYNSVPVIPGLSMPAKGLLLMLFEQHRDFVVTSEYVAGYFEKEGCPTSEYKAGKVLRELEDRGVLLCLPAKRDGKGHMSGSQYVMYARVTDPVLLELCNRALAKKGDLNIYPTPSNPGPRERGGQYQDSYLKEEIASFSEENQDPEPGPSERHSGSGEESAEDSVPLAPNDLPDLTLDPDVDPSLIMMMIPPAFRPVPGIETWDTTVPKPPLPEPELPTAPRAGLVFGGHPDDHLMALAQIAMPHATIIEIAKQSLKSK